MFLYPNVMVPLQIDLAIGMGQYLAAVSANHASLRLRSDVPDAETSAMRASRHGL